MPTVNDLARAHLDAMYRHAAVSVLWNDAPEPRPLALYRVVREAEARLDAATAALTEALARWRGEG